MVEERQVDLSLLLAEMRRIEVHSARLVTGVMAGGYASVFRGSGLEFDQVREYEEGDDPRSVDWNVTARVGRPYVKEFVDERELTVLFVLDLSASMESGGFSAWSARQTAARVCACLALSAVRNNDKVGLIAFSRGVDRFVPARKGIRHALRVVRDCLALPGGSTGTELVPALELAARAVRRHAVLFVISDFLSDGWQTSLTACARRHDVIAVRMVTPEQLSPPESGLMRVRDPETGRVSLVDWSCPRSRATYRDRVDVWRKRVERDFLRAKIDRIDVPVPLDPDPDAVARPILEFFRMRELRGAKR